VQAYFPSEHLVGLTLLNHFSEVFKYGGLEVTNSQDFLGCRKPEKMTTTGPFVEII
jgi:hypothetical protein